MEPKKTWIELAMEELRTVFADGFQIGDIMECSKIALRYASHLGDLTEDELVSHGTLAVNAFIEATDTPWLPDTLSDPIMKAMVPSILRGLVQAANGKMEFLKVKAAA